MKTEALTESPITCPWGKIERQRQLAVGITLVPALPVALASYFVPAPVVLLDDEESECEVDGWLHYLSEIGIPDIGEEAAQ